MVQNALELSHKYISETVKAGDCVIDATAGNGNDTLFLANLVGDKGKVYAFDIQESAVENTKLKLYEYGVLDFCKVILDGHQNMKNYVSEKVKAVMFNFGYLPGGDKSVFTHKETSIPAIEAAMDLIADDGIITLAIYYGGKTGFEEKDALIEFLKTVDNKKFSVLYHNFINYPNCPPLVVTISKC